MDYNDAQIEIALLKSIERQAKQTAAALAKVKRLMRDIERSTTTTDNKQEKKG